MVFEKGYGSLKQAFFRDSLPPIGGFLQPPWLKSRIFLLKKAIFPRENKALFKENTALFREILGIS